MKKLTTAVNLIALLLIAGCGSSYYVRRDVKKLDALSIQYPSEFARLSNELNPCFTGKAKSDTIIRHTSDTLINSVPRLVPGAPGKPDTVYFAGKTVRNTVYTTIHDTVADNRALNACNVIAGSAADSLLIIKTQNAQLKSDKKSLVKWVVGLSLAMLSVIGMGIYKFLSGWAGLSEVKKFV